MLSLTFGKRCLLSLFDNFNAACQSFNLQAAAASKPSTTCFLTGDFQLLLLSFYFPATSVLDLCCFSLSASALLGNKTDELALLEFKAKITDDPFGVTSSWNRSNRQCQRYGITCDPRNQRVTVLNLKSLKLSGSISPCIGNLSFLQELSLQNNSLVGEIPPSIGRLSLLKELSLQRNFLSGEIPANLSACENLLLLVVESNELAGGIPAELGFLKKLQSFDILPIINNNYG